MSHVVEADEKGAIHLSPELLHSSPKARYTVDVTGDQIILKPVEVKKPLWETASSQEWVESFLRMVEDFEKLPPGPSLSNEALRRENIYD